MLAGYAHLLAAARRLQWDADAIDLRDERRVIAGLADETRATLTELVAGFCVAEHAVAVELAPWTAAAGRDRSEPLAAECFAVQARDEARHARFFDRVWTEALGRDPGTAAASAPPAIAELFCTELPAAARALARDAGELADAVGLYHLVLEGIVFAVGQQALLELARDRGLRGIADGVARVQGDERWHIGLGVLALQRLGAPVQLASAAGRAIAAWGPQIATAQRTEPVLAAHARRLAIAGARARAPTPR
jgi:ribonucleoside-diphosphate reductase beta chain